MTDLSPRLIGLDWGTTSCRAYLLGDDGAVFDQRPGGRGVLALTQSGNREAAFERELADLCGPWLERNPKLPLVASGMVGSNQGWVEAGYQNLPVDLMSRPDYLTEVATPYGPLYIIPGLFKEGSGQDFPDVIRGEETQLLGALPEAPHSVGEPATSAEPAVVVLPGTHTKWVRLEGTVVTDFVTSMTGELFGLVTKQSIIARLAEDAQEPDITAFERGLDVAFGREADIASTLFSARTLVMAGQLKPTAVKDYVSGLMIGAEVERFARSWMGEHQEATICANAQLAWRYARALERAGVKSTLAPEDAVATGLWRTAVALGIVDRSAIVEKETP
ncbi:2-dehydro-3-deoxygalactonokinase [Sinomonas gamaensis]|uniref:2-dehydro-3-deoxygalactonokinase n=1 Tax=Sinomonas gamaensis TaxID=2565624 RepID=UPI001109C5CA|nr:2-dehydro-3-deoxygalactonokinase [Sinomonas gamaensis]